MSRGGAFAGAFASAPHRAFLAGSSGLAVVAGAVLQVDAMTALGLAGLLVLALSWARAQMRSRALHVWRSVFPSAFEGDEVRVRLVLENRSRPPLHLVEVADVFGPGLAERQLLMEPGPLPGRHRRGLGYHAVCSRTWGVHVVGPLTLRVADGLGLFPRRRVVLDVQPFAVFPRVPPLPSLEATGARRSLFPGQRTAARAGQGTLHLGVRDYAPGDELRRMHWPATARHGRPMVKEQEQDLLPYLTVLVDLGRERRAGTGRKSTLDYLVRTAAALVWRAAQQGDVVQLVAAGARPLLVPPGRGTLHAMHCLWELIRVRQDGTTPLLQLLERDAVAMPSGSTAVLLFGTVALARDALARALDALLARGVRPVTLFVSDHTFLAIDRWPITAEEAAARGAAVLEVARERGLAAALLEAEVDLEDTLSRPDLLLA